MSLYAANQMPDEATVPQGSIKLQNTTTAPFSTEYLDDTNAKHSVTLEAGDTREFPAAIGRTIQTHLANHVLYHSDFDYKTDVNIRLAKIKEEITM